MRAGPIIWSCHDFMGVPDDLDDLRQGRGPPVRSRHHWPAPRLRMARVQQGRQSLPAEPQTVALYLGRLAADGRAMATIAQARAAISHAHAAEGMAKGDNPARHPVVAETVKGWQNQVPAPQQASTAEALAHIRETAQLVKGTPLKELDHRRGVAIPGERTHLSETKRANFRSRDYQGPKTVKLETGVEECFA